MPDGFPGRACRRPLPLPCRRTYRLVRGQWRADVKPQRIRDPFATPQPWRPSDRDTKSNSFLLRQSRTRIRLSEREQFPSPRLPQDVAHALASCADRLELRHADDFFYCFGARDGVDDVICVGRQHCLYNIVRVSADIPQIKLETFTEEERDRLGVLRIVNKLPIGFHLLIARSRVPQELT